MMTCQSLPNPRTIKTWKEIWTRPEFSEGKMFCELCRKHREKLKNMSGFTEAFMQGSDQFKTSALSDHDKSKIHMQAVNEGEYIENTKRGE